MLPSPSRPLWLVSLLPSEGLGVGFLLPMQPIPLLVILEDLFFVGFG